MATKSNTVQKDQDLAKLDEDVAKLSSQLDKAEHATMKSEKEYWSYMLRVRFWKRVRAAFIFRQLSPISCYHYPNLRNRQQFLCCQCNSCEALLDRGGDFSLFTAFDVHKISWEPSARYIGTMTLPPVCRTCRIKVQRRWDQYRNLLTRIQQGHLLENDVCREYWNRIGSPIRNKILAFVSQAF